jgi:hypothetical protein
LAELDATIVVFLDGVSDCCTCRLSKITVVLLTFVSISFAEINTASCLGPLKEVIIDHSIAGDKLQDNIVVIAACNPPRTQIQSSTRERDLGKHFASGHYQVSALPATLQKMKWNYGSLSHGQEKDFICRKIQSLDGGGTMPAFLCASLTEVVSESHQIMRKFAERNILDALVSGNNLGRKPDELAVEAEERARSIVSLRNIQRVFALFEFFCSDMKEVADENIWSNAERQRRAMLLAIATVYYFRLDCQSRAEFLGMLRALPTEASQQIGMLTVLGDAMDQLMTDTEIPSGIAVTNGLKENLWMTVVCSMARVPLIIVEPPGSSKTLAVNAVEQNANGTDSVSLFYRNRPRLSLFHYQCSKSSTSREIALVFAQASQRQERVDPK